MNPDAILAAAMAIVAEAEADAAQYAYPTNEVAMCEALGRAEAAAAPVGVEFEPARRLVHGWVYRGEPLL